MTGTVKIKGAWWVSGRATVSDPPRRDKQVGTLYARGLDDKIYEHRVTEFVDPKGMVDQIKRRGCIELRFWKFKTDDSAAAAYYDNHFEPGEPR